MHAEIYIQHTHTYIDGVVEVADSPSASHFSEASYIIHHIFSNFAISVCVCVCVCVNYMFTACRHSVYRRSWCEASARVRSCASLSLFAARSSSISPLFCSSAAWRESGRQRRARDSDERETEGDGEGQRVGGRQGGQWREADRDREGQRVEERERKGE